MTHTHGWIWWILETQTKDKQKERERESVAKIHNYCPLEVTSFTVCVMCNVIHLKEKERGKKKGNIYIYIAKFNVRKRERKEKTLGSFSESISGTHFSSLFYTYTIYTWATGNGKLETEYWIQRKRIKNTESL